MVIVIAAFAMTFSNQARAQRSSASESTATGLAADVLDVAVKAHAEGDGGSHWQELENRLAKLYRDSSKEGDEAVVILMSFYLGEHNGEELNENLLDRGPRMIPLLKRYLSEEPASLLTRCPEHLRLKRATTVMFLNEALQILKVRAGARHVSDASIETAPYREQSGTCKLKLVQRPPFKFGEHLIRPGEAYSGAPVLRADIEEEGNLTNLQVLSSSGIRRLDAFLLDQVSQWKYAPRKNCGVVRSNIVITIDWMAAN